MVHVCFQEGFVPRNLTSPGSWWLEDDRCLLGLPIFWGYVNAKFLGCYFSKIGKFHANSGESMYLSKHGHGNQLAFHRHENFFDWNFIVMCCFCGFKLKKLFLSTSQTIHSKPWIPELSKRKQFHESISAFVMPFRGPVPVELNTSATGSRTFAT